MIDAKPPKDKEKDAGDTGPPPDPDEVLRRMLETPPKPHKQPARDHSKGEQDGKP